MPPKICILPSDPSSPSSASPITFVTLPHPRSSAPTRYVLHPTLGLHEFTHLPARQSTPRSWLLTPSSPPASSTSTSWLASGHIISDSSLYISTRLDPLFLLLPALLPAKSSSSIAGRFIPMDDIVEALGSKNDRKTAHWAALLKPGSTTRSHIEDRIRAASDSIDVGGESAFRASERKVLDMLVRKCDAMVKGGLPKSMEEEFVAKPLVKPLASIPQSKAALSTPAEGEGEKTLEIRGEGSESKEQTEGVALPTPPETQQSTSDPAPTAADDEESQLRHLLRLRTASQFLAASYLPSHIEAAFITHFATLHDFTTLDAHLAELKRQRTELTSLRSSDFSMKRSLGDEEADDRAEKKRKKEDEEKKKKKMMTQGVKQLSKVNTRGMAKMTSFFKKVETKK